MAATRLNSPLSRAVSAIFLLVLCLQLQPSVGQNATCERQPSITEIDPPSGTTGSFEGLSTVFTITGEELDSSGVQTVFVEFSGTNYSVLVLNRTTTKLQFRIEPAINGLQRVAGGSPASVLLVPNLAECRGVSIAIGLHPTISTNFQFALEAQPGTVIFPTIGSCFPNTCGDNSTDYNITVGGFLLETIENSADGFIARFPNFDIPEERENVEVSFVTQYQTFTLFQSTSFDLMRPGEITSISPPQGQRGTVVQIMGDNLIGLGSDIALSAVTLGSIGADISEQPSPSDSLIQVQANSGLPGVNLTVRINTTQAFMTSSGAFTLDGPYTYLDAAWTQLEDGIITEVIPLAAQTGSTVTLCGERLLGGGSQIATLTLAGVGIADFTNTPFPSTGQLPQSECVTAVVPNRPSSNEVLSGRVVARANTQAIVESAQNFTFAVIRNVQPPRGQFGTIVRITGDALLSGYASVIPTVYLSGVEATVLSADNSEVLVEANMPAPQPEGNATVMPEVFGTPGTVEIVVNGSFGLFFNVSLEEAWTIERPGEVETITPSFGTFGTRVIVSGSNLLAYGNSLTHATVGGINATILGATDDQVTLAIPDISSAGLVNVTLFSITGAEVFATNGFEYRMRGEVFAVEPSSGQFGTYVDITGSNLFGYGSNISSVTFGDAAATIDHSQSNDTHIRVRVSASNNTAPATVGITIIADTFAITESNLTGIFWTYLVQGEITNTSPNEGQEGTRITITGSNLLGGGSNISEIFLDGVPASVQPAGFSPTSISVVMGDIFSRRAELFPGQVYIMADTGAIVSGGTYTHRESGTITNFTPQSGRRGTIVTLTGSNLLGFGSSIVRVLVAGFEGDFESIEDNSTVLIRAGDGDPDTQGPIQLIINTGAVVSSASNFTYGERGVVSSVTPTQGAEGSGVLVSGSALRPNMTTVVNVTIGGSPVSRIVTESLSSVAVIAGPAPLVNSSFAEIVITASDGSFVNGAFFSYINLTIALPDRSSGREGTLVNISLPDSFTPSFDLRASIDDIAAMIVNVGPGGLITVAAPRARLFGTYSADVAVETTSRLVARLRDGFTYIPEGVVCTITPSIGQRGTRVTLAGTGLLGGGAFISMATIAGISSSVTSSSDEEVSVVLSNNPLSPPLTDDIVLIADSGAIVRRLNSFTFVEPGVITSIDPPVGHFGTVVRIAGSRLLQGGDPGSSAVERVSLAGVPAVVLENSTDSLIIVQAQASGSSIAPVEVVLASGAIITSGPGVTFEYLLPGVITNVNPSTGTTGTRLQITGTNLLGGGSSIRSVTLNGVEAIVSDFSNSIINATSQEGQEIGAGDVIITANTGAVVVLEQGWSYEALGVIETVAPLVGQRGQNVTITGQALLGTSANSFVECTLAGIPAEIVTSSTSEVTCTAGLNPSPPGDSASFTGPVQLTTDTGVVIASFLNFTNFTYYFASIDGIEPTRGNNGTIVRISGRNLFGFPGSGESVQSVFFGDIEVREITNADSNDLVVRVGPSDNETTGSTVRVVSTSGAFLELLSAWNYTGRGEIASLSVSAGLPGTEVVITGSNLVSPAADSVQVILGQTPSFRAEFINSSLVSFRAGVYQNVTGNLDAPGEDLPVQIVSSSGQTVFNSSVTFRYNATGVVISSTPPAGQAGATVTITGTDLFRNGTNISQVYLAGVAVSSIDNATAEQVIVTAGSPPTEGAVGAIVIESDDGSFTGLAGDAWRYFPVLTASNVSPQTGQNGTIVTIDRSSIQDLPELESVTLAGVPATIVSINQGSLTLQAQPSNATTTGPGDIVFNFTDNIVVAISDAWSYESPVVLSLISPASGYFNTSVTLSGANFLAGGVTVTSVSLARVQTSIESQSDSQITVRISENLNSASSELTGPVVIQSSQGATFTSVAEFTYVQLNVNSVSPPSGQRGTNVFIRGVGLLAGGSSVASESIILAGVAGTVLNATDTVITAMAGAFSSASNISSITYTVDTGAMVTIPNSWRYITPGEVRVVTPAAGNLGTTVTITGERMFAGGLRADRVFLNGVQALGILVNNENVVQVVAGGSSLPLAAGSVQIVADSGAITESDGVAERFSYDAPGFFMSFSRVQGQNGTRVIIDGSTLPISQGVGSVFLAGVEASIESTDIARQIITVRAGRPSIQGEFSGRFEVRSTLNTTTISNTIFTYLAEGRICVVSPLEGQRLTVVTIQGERLLGGGTSIQQAFLAGVEAIVSASNDSVVILQALPFPNATQGDIVLISNTQAYISRIDGWSYVQEGTIDSVSPSVGQFGTRITITGSNLQSGGDFVETVLIDNIPALEIVDGFGSSITVRAGEPPSNNNFTASTITLISNFRGELRANVPWTYLPASAIISVNPSSGTSSMEVTITGTNLLGGGSEIVQVITDNIPAEDISVSNSNTEVRFRVGINTGGISRIGDIIIESDTGARTVQVNGWTFTQECPSGNFGDVTEGCQPCDTECERCFGPLSSDCTACVSFRIDLNSSLSNTGAPVVQCVALCPNVSTLDRECRDACEINQYIRVNSSLNTTFCFDCNPLCEQSLSCSGPEPSECQRCQFFYDTLTLSCVASCPLGTFVNELSECVPCHTQCETAAGCSGPAASDCNVCSSVRISSVLSDLEGSTTGAPADFCIEQCPSRFFTDSGSFCQPCASECASTCTGPTPFDCDVCQDFSVIMVSDNRRRCVSTCNPAPAMLTMYSDAEQVCQPCDSTCSLTGGCTGPTARDCNGCRIDNTTGFPLPTFEGSCLIVCPNISYYNDNRTLRCELCNSACTNGCSGPTDAECIASPSSAFQAGEGTIAVVIVVIVILAILVVLIGICWLVSFKKRDKYTPEMLSPSSDLELGDARYARREDIQETSLTKEAPPAAHNLGFTSQDGGELYSQMGPEETNEGALTKKPEMAEELYTDVPQEDQKEVEQPAKSEGVTGSQELYTDMEPAPLRPPKPAEKAPAPLPQKTEEKPKQKAPAAVPAPSSSSSSKDKPPQRPPSPEVYTDMEASVTEVYVNPVTEEEYSEMASPNPDVVADELYDDAGSVAPAPAPTHGTKPPPLQLPKQGDDQAPLITSIDDDMGLYEDTESAMAAVEQYKRTTFPRGSSTSDAPPDLPSRPIPSKKQRLSTPLPLTPLQKSLTGSVSLPRCTSPVVEDLYEATEGPIEESLYEDIGGLSKKLLPGDSSPPPVQSSKRPAAPPERVAKKNSLPLPPRK